MKIHFFEKPHLLKIIEANIKKFRVQVDLIQEGLVQIIDNNSSKEKNYPMGTSIMKKGMCGSCHLVPGNIEHEVVTLVKI